MTLTTYVQLVDHTEVELQEMFLVMRDIAGIPPEWPWISGELVNGWIHEPGCPTAHARVDMWRDGPPPTVQWDTPYGYEHEGEGCTDLHARFIRELGERRPEWFDRLRWCDESTGDWFDMGTDPSTVLCGRRA